MIRKWFNKNYDIIHDLVGKNDRILDLGCGDGSLLKKLQKDVGIRGQGVEIQEEKVIQCIKNGVPVIQADLDKGLADFRSQSFDFVILNQTLQVVRKPDLVLREMLRIGRTVIVTFPNFAYWKIRVFLFFKGRLPVTNTLPYRWFNSPNIHLVTVKDFTDFCRERNYRILDRFFLSGGRANSLISRFPNLLATESLFLITRKEN